MLSGSRIAKAVLRTLMKLTLGLQTNVTIISSEDIFRSTFLRLKANIEIRVDNIVGLGHLVRHQTLV